MPEDPNTEGQEPTTEDEALTQDAEPTEDTATDQETAGDAQTDGTPADGTDDAPADGEDSPEHDAEPDPEPEHVLTQQEMQAAIDEAEQRARDAEERAESAERMQRVAEGERDAANEARDRAQRLTTLAAGLVGQAGMYAVASAIVMADDTHYELVDEMGEVEEKLVQFSELFDGLVAEASPETMGEAMDIQKYVSSIIDMGDAGVSAL